MQIEIFFNTNGFSKLKLNENRLTLIFFSCFLCLSLLLFTSIANNNLSYGQKITDPISLTKLNYDNGSLSQWKCTEYKPPTNNLQVVKSPVKQGPYSLKTTLRSDAIEIQNTHGERAEVKYCDSLNHAHLFKSGDDVWTGWYTYFPNSTFTIPTTPHSWHVLTQWHGTPEISPGYKTYGLPITFNLNGNLLNLRINTNLYDQQNPACTAHIMINGQPNISCGYLWATTIQKGHWYKIVLHIRWSNTTNGLVEGTIDGIPINTFHGILLNRTGNDDSKAFLKQGLYRNNTINVLQEVYHDGTVIAECPTNAKFDLDTLKCISLADTAPPETTITSIIDRFGYNVMKYQNVTYNGISYHFVQTEGLPISVSFSGMDNEGISGFQCSLNGEPFSPCTSPISYNTPKVHIIPPLRGEDPVNTLKVRAVDNAGNIDLTPYTFTFVSWIG
jgi:hypothetical protein